jgi:hypothetical protein
LLVEAAARQSTDVTDAARPPAPPYDGEGPHALWHYSEDPTIEVFRPHRAATAVEDDHLVWAIDTRHAPTFWFPRDCPRGCAWTSDRTTPEDRQRLFGHTDAPRIHVIEQAWLATVRSCRLYAYRLPEAPFERHSVGGYWVAQETVEPLELVEVGDLLQRHADAGIELRISPSIWTWWVDVAGSTLEFSGSRLRNCTRPMPESLRGQR